MGGKEDRPPGATEQNPALKTKQPRVVVNILDPSTERAKAGGSLFLKPAWYIPSSRETLSQKNKNKIK